MGSTAAQSPSLQEHDVGADGSSFEVYASSAPDVRL